MKCPLDATDLVMSERSGIEIDYCPKCRGVWLDRGELDKIIERSGEYDRRDDDYRRDRDHDRSVQHHDPRAAHGHPKKKKRKDFFSELFEFGD